LQVPNSIPTPIGAATAALEMPRTRGGIRAAALLMLCSGAAGLVWQMLWTAQFAVALGHEIAGVLSVLAAFFGGLALGALAFGRRIAQTRRPGRWYAALEAVVAVWAIFITLALPGLIDELARLIGPQPSPWRHWGIAFVVPLLLLAPATMAMGATLPAIDRLLRAVAAPRLGLLYGANTLGAMAGVLLAVFVCIPALGHRNTAWLFAGVNALCALLAWWLWPGCATDASAAEPAPGTAASRRAAQATLLLTGLLGVGYEVLVVRVLSQATENTVYTYALLLAVYLLGTAGGASIYQRGFARRGNAHAAGSRAGDSHSQATRDRLLIALAAALISGALALAVADRIYAAPLNWLGAGRAAALAGEALAAAAAMLLPTLAMGALFTHLATRAQATGLSLGRALAVNTLGAALAPGLIGVLLLPAVGARLALVALVLGYLALGAPTSWRRPALWIAASATLALALRGPTLGFINVPEGGQVLSHRDGVMAAVSVIEDADGVARLHINNRVQEGSSASGSVEIRLAELPLLLHPAPRRALFLGLGTGYTARVAALDPATQVDAVELLPEVIAATGLFAERANLPADAPQPQLIAADARRYALSSPEHYDVIVADLYHPGRNGAGGLYTAEHYAAIRDRLADGGVFCQWLALHQMDLDTLRSIVAAYLQIYPDAIGVIASNSLDTPVVGLVARKGGGTVSLANLDARLRDLPPREAAALRLARLDDAFAIAGSALAGPATLRRFAADAEPNTDDRPVVTHRAPWTTYAPEATPRQRLAALLDAWVPAPAELLADPADPASRRIAAYWAARQHYLRIGMDVRPDADPAVMLQALRGPLLDVLALSPDFRPAAEPLLALANAVRASNAQLADETVAAVRRALAGAPLSQRQQP